MNISQIIKSLPFFDHFSPEDLIFLTKFLELKNYPPGGLIVNENQINTTLYFLLKGSVEIVVHGKPINLISKFGAVFGEMSLSGSKASFAKILSHENSTFLIFNFLAIHELPVEKRDYLEKLVYKSFAEVLALRLNDANLLIQSLKNSA